MVKGGKICSWTGMYHLNMLIYIQIFGYVHDVRVGTFKLLKVQEILLHDQEWSAEKVKVMISYKALKGKRKSQCGVTVPRVKPYE